MNGDTMIHISCAQVLKFLRPGWVSKNDHKFIAISLAIANKHFKCEQLILNEIKKMGRWNVTVCLLHDDSTDGSLEPKINGKYRKCVAIPESLISKDVLDSIYEGEILNGIHDFTLSSLNMSSFVASGML